MKPEKLFDAIEAAILEEPKRINMEDWAFHPNAFRKKELPMCKTVGCIAGWACSIGLKLKGDRLWEMFYSIESSAQDLLGLDFEEATQLFLNWPSEWVEKLDRHNPGTKAYAKVVVDYIRWWRKENRPTKAKK